ncbi:prolyl oligopeptidase family serine peptidase [Shewanella corallii]|uniref:Prolyl oligopeptidase family serine peptidase n=1 Tax=Shewanella corallii TaxID=560080 RepID=A0ABT0N4P9_9GAMM|nr:prolyl oligopeptidase family serine peptidase [Shewanella corallii]MCL2913438.1 prolyl oligopeptidase family serine peptidase [Shewanella corallii]
MRGTPWLLATLLLFSQLSWSSDGYQLPPDNLQQVVEQTSGPVTMLSPDKRWMAVMGPTPAPSISELARNEVRLGGLRIDPERLTPSRVSRQYESLVMIPLFQSDKVIQLDIQLPEGITYISGRFSPDNRFFSFAGLNEQGAYLYLYELESQKLTKLKNARLNATISSRYQWLADSSAILFRQATKSNTDARHDVKAGPVPLIKSTGQQKTPRRTYQDLLKTPADADYFQALTLSQPALVTPGGKLTKIGKPGVYGTVSLSPDNRFLLLTRLAAPFSYRVKYYDFAKEVVVIKLADQSEKVVALQSSGEIRPSGPDSVTPGKRSFSWHPAKAASLVWLQSADNGDSKQKARLRDELYQQDAPFAEQPTKIVATPWRITAVDWINETSALITQRSRKQQKLRLSLLQDNALTQWHERGLRDSYKHPGTLHKALNSFGKRTLAFDSGKLLHYGLGASDAGYQPFLKRTQINNGDSQLLWETRSDKYQRVKYVLNEQPLELIISSETKSAAPSIHHLNVDTGESRLLYQSPDRLSAFKDVQKQLVNFTRNDGLELSGTLYLPAGYQTSQGPLPVIMWAYPREFKDKSVASQVAYSPNQYLKISPRSPIALVSQGYAVFDRVAMPVIGEGKSKPNDTFREQLVANASAAIDKLVAMGVADRNRIAIGGHSYGAFMVANLLAHSDLFAAGIARSGAYNRTLTPFGFQNEERNFWQATSLYKEMSPFTHADKIDEPILLIHGEMDSNSGTYPMQSDRLFNAIAGLGGTAKLVILPWESHSYKAKESLNHLLWEQLNWLDTYLKPTSVADTAEETPL